MKRKLKSENLINSKTTAKGLPGKSYIYILELDKHIKNILSLLYNLPILDLHVASKVQWKTKSNDREKVVSEFLNYMACYDNTRVNFLLPSKIIKRSDFIQFISQLDISLSKYKKIIEKKDKTYEETLFLFKTQNILKGNLSGLLFSTEKVNLTIFELMNTLITNYLYFIVKGLMARRKSEKNPNKLNTDAYNVLLDMIDSYNVNKSKIPFNKYLKFFILAKKNKIIKYETWNLEAGQLKSLETIQKSKKDRKELNEVFAAINRLRKDKEKDEEFAYFLSKLEKNMPPMFFDIMLAKFGVLLPLTPQEEITILLG
jgi:hypothetical protein